MIYETRSSRASSGQVGWLRGSGPPRNRTGAPPSRSVTRRPRTRPPRTAIAEGAYRALSGAYRALFTADDALRTEDAAAPDDVTLTRAGAIGKLALRMDELLDSLESSRPGRAGLGAAPVPVDDVLDDIEEILGPRLAAEQVRLRRRKPLGTLSCDRIRLQGVLVNLVSNAVTYAAETPPRWIEVGVEDIVPPDASEPVHACYVRGNGPGGAGAPLTVSRRIVEHHGGRLWAGPAPGQDSTSYYFTL